MAKVTAPERLPQIYVGVGVGTYEHHEQYQPLQQAILEVKDVSEILAEYGYDVRVFQDPDRSVADELEDFLPQDVMRRGGSLVILWSGHGEPAKSASVNLIAHDTRPGSPARLTPEYLTDLAARTGANQILLILDTCFSGGGVIPAATVADAVLQELPPDADHVGFVVIASTMDYERAKDGVFGARLKKLLRYGPDDSELKQRWCSQNDGVPVGDFIEALFKEWDDLSQRPKPAQIGLPLLKLPNPLYKPPSQEQMDTHLLHAARGGEPDDEGRSYFTGRVAQLNRIVAWMRDGKPGAFVVTGPPGIGKSAILGRIVSLSNHEERTRLPQGPLEHADPGQGSVKAHVHVLRYTAERLVAAIDDQLVREGLLPADASGPRSRGELQGAIQHSGTCPVIVVDGLNESGFEAWRIAEDVLRTLSEVSLVLVGTQDLPPADGPLSLIKTLGAKEIIDLGEATIQREAESDLRRYVENRLAGVVAPAMDVSQVADIILEFSREQRAGAFLLARFITTQLRNLPVDTSVPQWEKELIHSIEETIEAFVASVPPLRRGDLVLPHAARELLEALAWAKGPGLPDDIWPIIATALSPTGTTYERSDVFWLLPHVGRYIVEDGQGGRAVYRLVHQWVLDHFRPMVAGSLPQPVTPNDQAVRIALALVDYYQTLLTARQLPQMSAYLWRYTWQHCADAAEPGIKAFRLLVERDPQAFAADLAQALSTLSKRQATFGLWQDAVKAAQETVDIYRALVKSDLALPDDLAEALVMLGSYLLFVGRWQEALSDNQEAVDLFRTMDPDNPAVRLPLAFALSGLGLYSLLEGHWDVGLTAAEEAVTLLKELGTDNPAFGPALALALTALGLGYVQTGQPREAVEVAQEAVALFRTMDTTNPTVREQFVWVLTVLGLGYVQTGQPREAVEVAQEAVALFRTMDTTNPTVGLMFASVLTVLGLGYVQTGQPREAVEVAQEAVALFRTMDTTNPTVGLMFASVLTALGLSYVQTGQPREAVEVAQEAVELSRTMDTTNPTVRQQFASVLTVLGQGYVQTGQPREAVEVAQEAVELSRTMDTTNPTVRQQFALVLTVLGQGYVQTEQPREAVEVAQEAVELSRTMDTTNPTVRQQFALALTVLGLGYSQTEQPREAVEVAQEAVELFRTMDTTNPTVRQQFAWVLTVLSLGYVQTEQPREAVEVAQEAVELFRTMDTTNPTVRQQFALALTVLSLGYVQTEQPREAVEVAQEAVELFRTMDTTNPAVRQRFAWVLTVLGLGYVQIGQPREAVEVAQEAVRIYQDLSGSNPAMLPLFFEALDSLSGYYREAGQNSEIDVQWEAAVESRERPRDKAYLLLRRAEGRQPGDTSTINELIRAKSYLTNIQDRERVADFHQVCRSIRAVNPASFDAAWRDAGGGELPQWLTLDLSYLALIWEWVTKEPMEAARDFLSAHIGELSPESTSVALDEIALTLVNPFAIEPSRELLQCAHELGVDEAYRPQFAMKLLNDWMSSDWAKTRTMLVERREELLGNAVEKAMQSLLAENPEDAQLITHKALLDLARTGKQALAFQAVEDPAQTSATLLDLAHAGDIDALDSVATLAFLTGETELVRALSCFYKAIALALRDQPDKALEAVDEARRLDLTQVPTWLALLVELAAKQHNELIPLSKALIAPLTPTAPGA